jgi:hypothetical protein
MSGYSHQSNWENHSHYLYKPHRVVSPRGFNKDKGGTKSAIIGITRIMVLIQKLSLATRITILMIFIRFGLRWLPLPKLLSLLNPSQNSRAKNLQIIQRAASYTDLILRWFPYNTKGNCLPRSLILFVFANRYGYPVKFHCGIRRGETGLDGHAWLTFNGQVFLESTRQCMGMVETYSYPHHS